MSLRQGSPLAAVALLAISSLADPSRARADMLWAWSYLNPDAKIAASGTLTTSDASAGAYAINSITGVWNGAPITALEPVKSCCSPPGWNSNVLVDGEAKLDKGGFAFSAGGGLKVNFSTRKAGTLSRSRMAPKHSAAFSRRRRRARNERLRILNAKLAGQFDRAKGTKMRPSRLRSDLSGSPGEVAELPLLRDAAPPRLIRQRDRTC